MLPFCMVAYYMPKYPLTCESAVSESGQFNGYPNGYDRTGFNFLSTLLMRNVLNSLNSIKIYPIFFR